jgi:MinD superfamily P-loop ATPase
MNIPMGVVVNRAGLGNFEIYDYCKATGLEIIAEIPYERRIAEAYAKGAIIAESSPDLREIFTSLAEKLKKTATLKKSPGGAP